MFADLDGSNTSVNQRTLRANILTKDVSVWKTFNMIMLRIRLQKRYSVGSMTRQNLVLFLPSSILDSPFTLLVFGLVTEYVVLVSVSCGFVYELHCFVQQSTDLQTALNTDFV